MSGLRGSLPLLILVGVVVVVIGSGIFLLTAGRGLGQFLFGRAYAEGELRGYAASVLKEELRGSSCQPFDTDNNGYVSCDFTVASQPNVTRSLECAAWGFEGLINRGCRTRLPNFQ
ncbi:hypothetical protein [Gloeobacter violaceus]|uniref:Gll1236 protein n=1 Tax=Gloeobacter violaceus (strain ATCC 29082 / PCC 7421) TaxID=251221 RepID=Q7NL90_GLOVI|nr:hypothetical protein [Gloeobacter violaceus]BAC89177.1 gll1236 [Gloeobacter violaceus PCC 7421]